MNAKQETRPLYSLDGIVIGTVLGSFIAGVFMVVANYVTLGSQTLAKRSAIGGLAIYVLIILVANFLPGTLVFALIVMFAQAGLAFFLATQLQGPVLRYQKAQGHRFHGLARSAFAGVLVAFTIFAALVTVLAILSV